jgi:hypothetical protein
VKIVRTRHVFDGLTLQVLGRCRRGGELYLTLVLPDGTRSLVPASWTDLPNTNAAKHDETPVQPPLLAACSQLLDTRIIVDGLLRRTEAVPSSSSPKAKETPDAATQSVRPAVGSHRRADMDDA